MDPLFLKGGFVCPCVTHQLGTTATTMYQAGERSRSFTCEHGAGVVQTDFESKLLGNVAGVYFTASIDAEGVSGTQQVSFLMRETEMLAAVAGDATNGIWIAHRVPGQLRDLPDDMYS